jgi:hypothetical protein
VRIELTAAALMLSLALVVSACDGDPVEEPTIVRSSAIPAPSVTPGTPFADLASGIIAIQTFGIPTMGIRSATFVGSVLAAGGIELQRMRSESPSDEQEREGIQSLAVGSSNDVGFTIYFYGTPELAREAVPHSAGEYAVLCREVLIVFNADASSPEAISKRMRSILEARFGSCEG